MKPSPVSLRLSMSFAFVALVLATSVVLGSITYLSVRTQLREQLMRRLGDIVATVSLSVDPAEHAALREPADMESPAYLRYRALFARLRALNPDIRFLYTLRQLPDGTRIFVLDSGETEEDFSPLGMVYEDSTPVFESAFAPPWTIKVESEFNQDQWGTWLSAFAPVLGPDGSLEGVLGLDISADQVIAYEFRLLGLVALVCLLVSLGGAAAGIVVSRRISKPLLALAADMGQIQQLALDSQGMVDSRIKEVKLMAESLDDMKKGLRSFRKYVPADIVTQLISLHREAVLGTTGEDLSIFFSDLENFTGLSESVAPERLGELLGGYFGTMTACLQEHRATVDKYIGDSIMAFWNAPLRQEDHALWACKAALACQERLEVISAEWQSQGLPLVRTRIGINTGRALVGNIGYEHRLSYTTLGDAVNLASRLESLNKYYGTSVLLGEETWKRVSASCYGRRVDVVAVKGKTRAGGVYELLGLGTAPAPWRDLIPAFESALGAYMRQEWDKADAWLDEVLALRPGDGPSLLLRKRMARFREDPPPLGWDGVTIMQDK